MQSEIRRTVWLGHINSRVNCVIKYVHPFDEVISATLELGTVTNVSYDAVFPATVQTQHSIKTTIYLFVMGVVCFLLNEQSLP